MLKIGLNDTCPYCGNSEVYRSRSETPLGRMCVLWLLDLARCHRCMRQHYRSLFFPALDFPIQSLEKILPGPSAKNRPDPLTDEVA